MVIQVLVIGITLGHTIRTCGVVDVPAHEVDGVVKIFAVGKGSTSGLLVLVPRAVQRLAVAHSRANAPIGDEPHDVLLGWPGIMLEARFLVHHRHRHLDGNLPVLLHGLGAFVPVRFLFENRAQVLWIAGR